jgi:hypothetical protein
LRVSLIFVVFEAGMPLIGPAAGSGRACVIGGIADYLAFASRLSERLRERAEQVAAVAQILLGACLVAERASARCRRC